MSCKVEKAKIHGKITCPPNKSYTHRALLIATLANGKSIIKNVLRSADTLATVNACKSFGAKIKDDGKNITIEGLKEFKSHGVVIDAANSGTTIRIASAIAALFNEKIILSGDQSLQQRPIQPLLDALEDIGAKCTSTDGKPPITVTGSVRGGEVSIPGNVSSQFISGLMIAAPCMEKGLVVNIEGQLVSKPYLDATIQTMKKFGVNVKTIIPYKKYIIEPQKYTPITLTIPSDFSSLALLLSASVLLGDGLTIKITKSDLPQGDKKIIDFLQGLGVQVTLSYDTITVQSPKKLSGGSFDLNDTPDLLPPLAILSLKTSKPLELFNVKHARFKETDRISVLSRELQKLGIIIKEKEDGLMLDCPAKMTGADLNSENDHRLFMAFCIAGMFVGDCTVSNPESVDVSYPQFIADINKVGGKIKPL
jgi:3-phosphoshikimate 1-carboxyvinyltransferase